jgi:hypothetical protein
MKQSEQFFRLSDQAGYETKPILLYYGLNQAARAIVAVGAAPGDPWELNGHGLTCPGLNQARTLGDVIVVDQGKDKSFQKLAEYMGAPTLPARLEFRRLWGSLPEGAETPLQGSSNLFTAAMLDITTEERSVYDSRYKSEVRSVRLVSVPRLGYGRTDTEELRRLLHEHYPSLRTLVPAPPSNRIMTVGEIGSNRRSVKLVSPDPQKHLQAYELYRCGSEIYSHDDEEGEPSTWVIPTFPGNAKPLEPIVTWWAVLYVLSMLARYQPSAWTKMLDIDFSPDAPAVEYLLDEAHRVSINLIFDAFRTVEQQAAWANEQDDPPDV